jgi:hemerythrin-like domain-containing protein
MTSDASQQYPSSTGIEHRPAVCRQTREEHDSLLDAMHQLEAALACAAPGREGPWNEQVRDRLRAVGVAIAAHVDSAEGRAGLFAEIESYDPNLEFRTNKLRHEHAELLQQAQALQQLVDRHCKQGTHNFQDVRNVSMRLLNALRNHQAAEADLVFEAFFTDLGVGD